MWESIVEATTGRGEIRLILQPLVAVLVGVRLGLADAHYRPPVHEVRSVLMAIIVSVTIDGYLQILSQGHMSWIAAIVVGIALIFIPYGVARSVTYRVYTHGHLHARS